MYIREVMTTSWWQQEPASRRGAREQRWRESHLHIPSTTRVSPQEGSKEYRFRATTATVSTTSMHWNIAILESNPHAHIYTYTPIYVSQLSEDENSECVRGRGDGGHLSLYGDPKFRYVWRGKTVTYKTRDRDSRSHEILGQGVNVIVREGGGGKGWLTSGRVDRIEFRVARFDYKGRNCVPWWKIMRFVNRTRNPVWRPRSVGRDPRSAAH